MMINLNFKSIIPKFKIIIKNKLLANNFNVGLLRYSFPDYWPLHRQILLGVFLCVLIFCLLFKLILIDKAKSIHSTVASQRLLQNQYVNKLALYKSINQFKQQNLQLINLDHKLDAKIIDYTDIDNLLISVHKLAQIHLLVIKSLESKNTYLDFVGLNLQSLEITLIGDYINLFSWLQDLMRLSSSMYIKDIDIVGSGDGNVVAVINLNIHYK